MLDIFFFNYFTNRLISRWQVKMSVQRVAGHVTRLLARVIMT